jgi:hypothetical protein
MISYHFAIPYFSDNTVFIIRNFPIIRILCAFIFSVKQTSTSVPFLEVLREVSEQKHYTSKEEKREATIGMFEQSSPLLALLA